MAYAQPPASALNFVFNRRLYTQPQANAVDFNMAAVGQTEYSPIPGVIMDVATPWLPTPGRKESALASLFQQARELNVTRAASADKASVILDGRITMKHGAATERSRTIATPWDDSAQPRENTLVAIHKNGTHKDLDKIGLAWASASAILDGYLGSSFLVKTPWKDRTATVPFRSTELRSNTWLRLENAPEPIAKGRQGFADLGFLKVRKIYLDPTANPASNIEVGATFEVAPTQPKDPKWCIPYKKAPTKDIEDRIPWGPSGHRDTTLRFEYPPGYIGPVDPWIPGVIREAEEKETYCTMNTVNVKRVSDNTPINMQDLTITLDVDSWAWRLTGTVIGTASLALIDPGQGGLVDVEVELNGHIWIFMVESYSGSREHANQRFTVQGVSKTQTLAAPYSLERSAAYTSTILANQIIDDELLNSGYEVIWDSVISWSIPADAFSFQDLAPIAIAKRIADAAGAVLVPDKSLQELKLKPRFKISPWTIDAAPLGNLDAQIPMAMVSRLSHQYQPAPLYDSVYVSGTTHGEATLVELSGTGGVAPAPDVYDDLMTDSDVNTERARQVIAGSGARGLYSLTMAVPEFIDAPGLLEPGMMVEVIESPASWRGYILGTSIIAPRSGAEKIEQTVEVVRFYEH